MNENTPQEQQEHSRSIIVNNLLLKTGLRQLLDDPQTTDIAINKPNEIWIENNGTWQVIPNDNLGYKECFQLANSLCVYSGIKGNLGTKFCMAAITLPTGERGHLLLPPVTFTNTIAMSFRRPSKNRFTLDDYASSGRLKGFKLANKRDTEIKNFQKLILQHLKKGNLKEALQLAVANRLNIALIGGTGSGKTTLTKSIADLYPINRRYITLETSHELDLPHHKNKLHLFYDDEYADKKKTAENAGLIVSPHECIKACMRMKPDHIFVTELRGSEAWYYFEALNTGHKGSLTTFHANDTVSSYERCLDMLREHSGTLGRSDQDLISKCKKTIDMVISMDNTYVTEVYYNPEEQLSLYTNEI